MRRIAVVMVLLCVLTITASAAYIPDEVVSENRNGRQLIIKTFTLSPGDDPGQLVEDPFELEGYSYHHLETVKQEKPFRDSMMQTETVTIETDTDDLSAILGQLPPSLEYSKDGYSGILTLDHATLQTKAAGYTTKHYTISDTREFTGLDRNDPSYVPTTTVKNGSTLKLSNITWEVMGTGLADDTLVPTSFTATATYTATGSRSVATGYVTTANYVGEVTAEGIKSVEYTVTYLGTPVVSDFAFDPIWLAIPGGAILLTALCGGAYLLLFQPNAVIYAMNARGVAYKKLGKQRISTRIPKLDLTKLKEYPAGDASVELPSKLAHKLASRIITIQLFNGTRTHLVEPYDGQGSYWFAIKEANDKEENEL